MKFTLSFLLFILVIPLVSHAQTLQLFLTNVSAFLLGVVFPFILGLAFLFFAINVIRFFVIGGSNEQGREKAKALIIYSLLAIVLTITFQGIVNIISKNLGFVGGDTPTSDYIK